MRKIPYGEKLGIIFLALILISCNPGIFIPIPDRSFTPQDLLITNDDLPSGWVLMFGPRPVQDNTRSNDSAEIAFAPENEPSKRSITQEVFRYSSIQGAKADFSEVASLPGETEISGWSFISDTADEQKISCYSYPNSKSHICTWLARYQEFVVEFYARIGDERLSIEEMENIVTTIDDQIQIYLHESSQ